MPLARRLGRPRCRNSLARNCPFARLAKRCRECARRAYLHFQSSQKPGLDVSVKISNKSIHRRVPGRVSLDCMGVQRSGRSFCKESQWVSPKYLYVISTSPHCYCQLQIRSPVLAGLSWYVITHVPLASSYMAPPKVHSCNSHRARET